MDESKKLMPVMVLPKGEMSPEDMDRLREIGVCCVEADNPDAVRFLEPPPMGYSEMEKAAIKLFRYVMGKPSNTNFDRSTLVEQYAYYLIQGTQLQPVDQLKKK